MNFEIFVCDNRTAGHVESKLPRYLVFAGCIFNDKIAHFPKSEIRNRLHGMKVVIEREKSYDSLTVGSANEMSDHIKHSGRSIYISFHSSPLFSLRTLRVLYVEPSYLTDRIECILPIFERQAI